MIQRNFDLTDKELGNYKIIRRLGKGGMATVYKAHELSLNRMVALKVLEPHLSEDPAFIKRFEREAQAAAQLNHPNIVQIYAIGEEEGIHFIAMEYVKGEPLSDIIKKEGNLEPKRAVRFIRQAAESLREAHRAGLVHRDVKPHNILVDSTGRVKVTDFGIAFIPQADTRLTQAGAVIGTPEYISPEQCQSKPVDARSDLYSLGVTLYEMLSGKTPYVADTPVSMLMKIVEGKFLPLGEVNSDVPLPLQQIVAKMMNPDPAARYQNADEVIAALDGWLQGAPGAQAVPPPPIPTESSVATPTPQSRSAGSTDNTKNALVLVAIVLVLAGLAFGGWKLVGSRGAASPRTETSSPADLAQTPPAEPGATAPMADTAGNAEESGGQREIGGPAGQPAADVTPAPADTMASVPGKIGNQSADSGVLDQNAAPVVPATARSGSGKAEFTGKEAGLTKVTKLVQPEPPWNSIVISVQGSDYEAGMVGAMMQSRFRDAQYMVLDNPSGRGNLAALARYQGVVDIRPLGSTVLNYYGRESELFTVSVSMKILLTKNGSVVAGPQSKTVKYTALNAEDNLRSAVAELSYDLQDQLSRRGSH